MNWHGALRLDQSSVLPNFLSFKKRTIPSFAWLQRLTALNRIVTNECREFNSLTHLGLVAVKGGMVSSPSATGGLPRARHTPLKEVESICWVCPRWNEITRSDPPPFQSPFLRLGHIVRREPVNISASMSQRPWQLLLAVRGRIYRLRSHPVSGHLLGRGIANDGKSKSSWKSIGGLAALPKCSL